MSKVSSYPKLFNLGHGAIKNLFIGEVLVEEKVDGSQFSFGVIDGELCCRSKGVQLDLDNPQKMFAKAVAVCRELAPTLTPGWVYRGEYLEKPKHNALAYDRTPTNHIIIFDINTGTEQYLSYAEKKAEASRIGLECVPIMYSGPLTDYEMFKELLNTTSVLGGQKIEGVVIKNYTQYGVDKHILIGKFVSEAFKEVHRKDWKERFPSSKDFVSLMAEQYKTPARWNKAVQHLAEAGVLTNSPKDIGLLIKEVQEDIKLECRDEILQQLFKWAWPNISRGVVGGLPQWYKEKLAESQFH